MSRPIFDIAIPEPSDRADGTPFRYVTKLLADGVRASVACDCPSCAIIGYLDSNDERVSDFFRPNIGMLGDLLHQVWAWYAFEGETYTIEAPVPWAHGVSHDDVLCMTGPNAAIYEVKTHSEKGPKAPSKANYRQAEFRLRLRELAGLPIPGPMRLVMIGKAGNEGGMVRGPWDVPPLTKDRRAEIDGTLATMDGIMARAATIDLVADPELIALANGCPTCQPKATIAAAEVHEDLDELLTDAALAQARKSTAEAAKKKADAEAKDAKAAYEKARDLVKPHITDTHTVVGTATKASKSRSGALLINAG